jgi:hypothetical protein
MLGRLSTTAAWAMLGLTACGMTRAGGTETKPAADGGSHPAVSERLCPSAEWDPHSLVAAGFDGNRLVALDGSGTWRMLHTFDVPADALQTSVGRQIIVESGRFTAVVGWSFEGSDGLPTRKGGESLRFDRSGDLIWRVGSRVYAPSDTGGVITTDGSDSLVRADGTLSALPPTVAAWTQRNFMTGPDADGWLLVLASASDAPPGSRFSKLGLVNLDGDRFVELPTPPAGPRVVRTIGVKHVYLSAEATWTLTFATPAHVQAVDLGIPVGKYETPLLTDDGRLGMIVESGKPRFRIDVDTERVLPIDSSPVDTAVASHVGYPPLTTLASGQWVLGAVDDEPVWLADAATGEVRTIDLERLRPLRRLEGAYCNSASLPDRGLIALGLRDDAAAGFYVGNADGTGWARVGRPYRNVQGIVGRRVANTWILYSATGEDTYCPGFMPFVPSPDPDDAIVGDAVQLVPPNAPPLVFQTDGLRSPYSFVLDPTGMCAYREPTGEETAPVVLDLGTARSVALDGITEFAWLSD